MREPRRPLSAEVHLTESLVSRPWAVPVVVSALPHVAPESVAASYSSARRTLLETFRGEVSVHRMVKVDFVDEEDARASGGLSWPQHLERWNAAAPRAWRYENWRVMARAYGHEIRSPRGYQLGPDGKRSRVYRGYSWDGGRPDEDIPELW